MLKIVGLSDGGEMKQIKKELIDVLNAFEESIIEENEEKGILKIEADYFDRAVENLEKIINQIEEIL